MKSLTLTIVAALCLCLCGSAMAQPDGGGRRPGGAGGPGGMFGRDALGELIINLGDANLSPGFDLTKEQKEKIQAVRDDHKKAMDKWREEHKADFDKLREQMGGLRGGGAGGDNARDKFREVMEARQKLMETAPKSDEAVKQIKAILTEEQSKKVDAKQAERQQQMQERFGGAAPGGTRRGGGADGAGGAAPGGTRRGGNRGGAGAGNQ